MRRMPGTVLSWRFEDDGKGKGDLWCMTVHSPPVAMGEDSKFKGSICLRQDYTSRVYYSKVDYTKVNEDYNVGPEIVKTNGNEYYNGWTIKQDFFTNFEEWHKRYIPEKSFHEPNITPGDLVTGFYCSNFDSDLGCTWEIRGIQTIQKQAFNGVSSLMALTLTYLLTF